MMHKAENDDDMCRKMCMMMMNNDNMMNMMDGMKGEMNGKDSKEKGNCNMKQHINKKH